MGIYFRDILLTRISRGANNCGQHPLEKNSYFIMRFSPHFQLFYFNDRLEFCEFFEGKIKRINNADLFSQLPLLIFIKGANISGGHCINHLHTHKHYPIGSSRPQKQVYKQLFPAFFSQFLDFSPLMNNTFSYKIKSACVFSDWPIWAFINNAKHSHLEFLLLIPMEKNHFLPSSCISSHSNDVMCKQPIVSYDPFNNKII